MTMNHIELLKEIILSNIDRDKYLVFLFGSRAGSQHRDNSDIDVGFYGADSSEKYFQTIKDLLNESIIPYHVDLVDFFSAESKFKKIALENIEIWNQPKDTDLNIPS